MTLGGCCITHAEIAQAVGVSIQTIRQAPVDLSSTNYRNPLAGWQAVLARLARERSRKLAAFAEVVER